MSTEEKGEYEVGWGKPPQHTRFAKGQSGNARGRDKGSKNFSTVLKSTLNETVVVNENGLRKNISKMEAMTKQLVNKAATGDPRATQLLLRVLQLMEGQAEPAAQERVVSESDREVVEGLVARIRRPSNGESNE